MAERGVHRLGTRLLCWYAIEDGGKLTLIDGGLVGYWDQLTGLLRRLGRTAADVEALVVSHGHPDHFGIAARLRLEAPSVRVLVHRADAIALTRRPGAFNRRSLPPVWRPLLFRYMLHLIRGGFFRTPAVGDVETFEDGAELDVPGRPRVIHAPGHTPGTSAFVLPDRGVLLSGDVLITIEPGGRHQPGPPLTATSLDPAAAGRALERLRSVEADLVLPGHGDPWHGSAASAVEAALG